MFNFMKRSLFVLFFTFSFIGFSSVDAMETPKDEFKINIEIKPESFQQSTSYTDIKSTKPFAIRMAGEIINLNWTLKNLKEFIETRTNIMNLKMNLKSTNQILSIGDKTFTDEDNDKTLKELGITKFEGQELTVKKKKQEEVGKEEGEKITFIKVKPKSRLDAYERTKQKKIENKITLKIMDSNKAEFTIEIDPNKTIEQLKNDITKIKGIPPFQQRLIFAGKILDDNETINDKNIYEDATIHLVLRLRPEKEPKEKEKEKRQQDEISVDIKTEKMTYGRQINTNWTVQELKKFIKEEDLTSIKPDQQILKLTTESMIAFGIGSEPSVTMLEDDSKKLSALGIKKFGKFTISVESKQKKSKKIPLKLAAPAIIGAILASGGAFLYNKFRKIIEKWEKELLKNAKSIAEELNVSIDKKLSTDQLVEKLIIEANKQGRTDLAEKLKQKQQKITHERRKSSFSVFAGAVASIVTIGAVVKSVRG